MGKAGREVEGWTLRRAFRERGRREMKVGINDVAEAVGARPILGRGRRMKWSRRTRDEDAAVQT